MKKQEIICLLAGLSAYTLKGNKHLPIANIIFDSRQAQADTLFFAIKGIHSDGHLFIDKAIAAGATAVVCEQLPKNLTKGITYISVPDSALAMGIIAANFYENPSKSIRLVGITGTNGKTTTATLLYNLFNKLGHQVGLISTIENRIDGKVLPTKHTTPDTLLINRLLARMVSVGCTHCFMEVSSHALVQQRTAGLFFSGAVFSNISHDHLDYHKTFRAYIEAKKLLFDELAPGAFALVNTDDKRGRVMLQNCRAKPYTYALQSAAYFKAKLLDNTLKGLLLDIDNRQVWFWLVGKFNAYNLLSTYATAVLLDQESDRVLRTLSGIKPIRGRFEQIISKTNIKGIIDYAHTPDALENILKTIDQTRKAQERIITVFGCGGDRDKAKRALMGKVAARWSDLVIITSDNPRSEDPQDIIADIRAGLSPQKLSQTLSITLRQQAIAKAFTLARPNDIVLIAGKGHEDYQEINGKRQHFDDLEVLRQLMN